MNKKITLLKEVGEKYQKGIVSLAEAATLEKVSIYRIREYVEREKIQAPSLTDAEMEEELKRSKQLFENIR
ncbi:MAG: hypothetical protein EU548_03420 [Promethearchaeota archaeon]|nr:MAG: hypothetical protein EU548_03420 [Candidatus Lokiarchaeota archaeon]